MMRLPQKIAKYIVYLPVARVYAGNITRCLTELNRSQYYEHGHLEKIQLSKLRRLVEIAKTRTPFYSVKLDGVPVALGSLSDLERLPCLTKRDLQEGNRELRSSADEGRLVRKTSGGSTGQPVTVQKTRISLAWELAAAWRGFSWAGVDIGQAQARFWGVPLTAKSRRIARVTDIVCNRTRLNAFDYGDESLGRYIDRLEEFRAEYFYGYVSMLTELADYIERSGRTLRHGPRAIITTSEVLTDSARATLARVFKARVFNEYGCGELGTVAHECDFGRLHLNEENMIVEVLDGDRKCGPGEAGELVITELNNTAMPLIRYRTGDFATIDDGLCDCGRSLRCLDGLHGRAYDTIRTSDGRSFHGEFMLYIMEDLKRKQIGIKQFQVIQTDWDDFLIRVVPGERYEQAAQEYIDYTIRNRISENAKVRFALVERIEREKSGKMRLVIGFHPDRSRA